MASSTNAPLSMPTPEEVLVYGAGSGSPAPQAVYGGDTIGMYGGSSSQGGGAGGLKPTLTWWRFWFGLYKRSQADIPFIIGEALTATGTTQGTALELTADWNEITGGAANTGVLLSEFGAGFASWVWNATGSAKKIYPPVGCAIDALGTNAAYSLAANKAQVFNQITATQFRSLQLG